MKRFVGLFVLLAAVLAAQVVPPSRYVMHGGGSYTAGNLLEWNDAGMAVDSGFAAGGEANTASNVGGGTFYWFYQKSVVDLQFYSFEVTSPITAALASSVITFDCPTCLVNSGSYADPSWITSLNWSKLTGTQPAPVSHAASHQNSGADEIATETAAAYAIPKAGSGGALATGWIPDLSAIYAALGHDHSGVYEPAGITVSDISDLDPGTDPTTDLEEETHASEHGTGAADEVAIAGDQVTSGTIAEPRIHSDIMRDAEWTAASDAAPGKVELATSAETNTGTDATRAVTPDGLEDWTGSAQVAAVAEAAVTAHEGAVDHDQLTNFATNEHVAITENSPANDELMQYVTDHWENQTPAEAGVQSLDAALTALAAGSDFVRFTGPLTGVKLFTLPNAAATILYGGGPFGTPSSGVLTNATGLPLTTGVIGILPLVNGGSNQNSWTASRCVQVNATGTALESASAACGGGGGSPGGSEGDIQFNISSAFAGRGVGPGLTNDGSQLKVDSSSVPFKAAANIFTDANTFQGILTISGAAAKVDASGATGGTLPFQATSTGPASCTAYEEFWVDSDDGLLYRCGSDGSSWVAVDSSSGAPTDAEYWVQTLVAGLSAEVVPPNGIVKSTSGVPSAAAHADVTALYGSGSCSGYLKSDGSCDVPDDSASSQEMTNKTVDAEGTGNTITTVSKIWLAAAGCQNTTASLMWNTPTSNPAVAACRTGTNTQKAVADFADGASTLSMERDWMLPVDWTGAIDIAFKWLTTATSGDVVWQAATICVADGETDDPAYNTASTVTDTAKGTTNQLNDATISGLTATGCAAGELLFLKVFRDPAHVSDTLAATARLNGITLTLRRAQ